MVKNITAIRLNIEKLYEQKWIWFAVYALLSVLFIYIINDIIITDPKYFTGGNNHSVRAFRNVYKVIYFFYPIYLFVKIVIISFFIKMSLSFFKFKEVKFMLIFTLVLIAEFVFLIPNLSEIIWFLFIHTQYTMEEVDSYSFLSLVGLIDSSGISSAYIYPVKLVNLFEVLYWILLIVGIKEITQSSGKQSFKIVASSYGLLLLVIIVFRYILFSLIL